MGKKRAILTGATGMIGIALIQYCIQQDTEVYALCRRGSNKVSRIPAHPLVHIVECNLDEMNKVGKDQIPPGNMFFHFGWESTIGDGRNNTTLQLKNVQYTLDAVALASRLGCEVFIGAGSQAEYGRYEGKLDNKVPTFPETGYGIAKLCAGQMSRIECNKLGIRHIWTRILSVYGPNDSEKTMVSSTIQKLLTGIRPSFTACEQKWDYLYCSDAARALYLLAHSGVNNKVYCIGSGHAQELKDYVYTIRDLVAPYAELGIGDIPYGEKQVMYLCADISALTEDTGFMPEVPFEDGIERTIDYMRRGNNYHEEN